VGPNKCVQRQVINSYNDTIFCLVSYIKFVTKQFNQNDNKTYLILSSFLYDLNIFQVPLVILKKFIKYELTHAFLTYIFVISFILIL